MAYDNTTKREIKLYTWYGQDGICVFIKDQNCVMFKLEKPVPGFKAVEFNIRLTVSGSDK